MCLAIVYYDPAAPYEFVMLETRDENVRRLHGLAALAAADRPTRCSYGAHWRDRHSLSKLTILHKDPEAVLDAEIVGGFDEGQGTWVAMSPKNRIAAKLLVAEMPGGGLGEAHNPLVNLAESNLVTRTGLCLAACSFRDAQEAADRLPGLLVDTLLERGVSMLPFRLVFGGPPGAFVLHFESPASLSLERLPDDTLSVVSTMGINDPRSGITRHLLHTLAAPAMRPDPAAADGWDAWVETCSFTGVFSDDEATKPAVPYLDPSWRAFAHSVYQPPYVAGGGPRSHMRPVGPGTHEAPIEWTCSSTCAGLSSRLPPVFLAEERPPLNGFPDLPKSIADIPFPSATRDFAPVEMRA